MRLLLDTQVFLWVVLDAPRLTSEARDVITAADEVFVSSASIWEVAIKTSLGKLDVSPGALVDAIGATGFQELPVSARHAASTANLPWHHRDPFDRLLVAQAIEEPLRLLTADRLLARYSELVLLV